jgi:hypothetical protein
MEYEVVKKWLDEKVDIFLEATKRDNLTSNICIRVSIDNKISVEGINIIADVMGLKLDEEPYVYEGETFYFYTFVYRGVVFSECMVKRLDGYGDTE